MFDPPHIGHVAAVRAAAGAGELLSPVHVVVTGTPPHRAPATAPPEARLAMARAAFADEPYALVSDIEVQRAARGEPNYMVETLAEVERTSGEIPSLVIGDDQLAALDRWHEWQSLVRRHPLVVVTRGLDDDERQRLVANLAHDVPSMQVRWADMPPVEVSSTQVRELLASGDHAAAARLVPPGVRPLLAQVYANLTGAG